jgi:error-prone DNA polymerase
LGVPLFQEQLLRMAMIAAGFTGGEAEELRRAMGFKRSEKRMKDIEQKLRRGMERKGIAGEVQDTIVQSITSFALYGFPESHAASFALLAYASAYLKCHYLAAFTAAMLNNQPMGFYSPATLVKDAQRHGLRIRPIDVTCSDWLCKLEKQGEELSVRLGMRYVRALRAEIAEEIVRERNARAFASLDDLKLRLPAIRKAELTALAEIGALNFIAGARGGHRRDALWQVERAARSAGPLLEKCEQTDRAASIEQDAGQPTTIVNSPLLPMTPEERLVADFRGTGMTVGPHPMKYHRASMKRQGVLTASELNRLPDGTHVRVAGGVIARQRPGTAKGFVFLSIEDETGIANAIVTPRVFEEHHVTIVHQQFLLIEGQLQHQQGVVSVKVESVQPLSITRAETTSHDFH